MPDALYRFELQNAAHIAAGIHREIVTSVARWFLDPTTSPTEVIGGKAVIKSENLMIYLGYDDKKSTFTIRHKSRWCSGKLAKRCLTSKTNPEPRIIFSENFLTRCAGFYARSGELWAGRAQEIIKEFYKSFRSNPSAFRIRKVNHERYEIRDTEPSCVSVSVRIKNESLLIEDAQLIPSITISESKC